MNSTPVILQSCLAVVSLSLILEYAFGMRAVRPKVRSGCGKVRCPKVKSLRVGSTIRAMIGEAGSVVGGAAVCVKVATVVLALLLMAGDIERNPGPETKEGMYGLKLCRRLDCM